MSTSLTQISNIFNLLCQQDTRIKNYKFGWRHDVNRNKQNNFDPTNSLGTQYPSVMFEPPEGVTDLNEPNYLEREEDVDITLYFDDLQNYNNDGTANTLNLIEQWDNLRFIVKDFLANFAVVAGVDKYNIGAIINNPKSVMRSEAHNPKLIIWEVTFTFRHSAPCTDNFNQVVLSALPDDIPESDIERGESTPVDACDLLLARLTEEQKNECILPSYDFSDTVVQSNVTVQQQSDLTSWLCSSDFTNEYAMQFSGSNYINGGNYAAIDFAHTDTFTLSCRIIADDWTQTRMIMGKRNASGIGYNLFSQSGKLRIVFRGGPTSNAIVIDTVDSLVNGQDYHILVSYTGSTTALGVSVYIDGVAVAKNPIQSSVSSTLSNTSDYQTGASNAALNMVGIIDCERVWNIALSGADALDEYNGGTPKAPLYTNNLVLWDKMGDDATYDGSVWTLPNPGLIGGCKSVGMNLASRIATPFV